jgi:2-keto-4-pentenoate hydratase
LIKNIQKIAHRQLQDYRNINPGMCFNDEKFSLSINEAYAVQDAVVDLRAAEGEAVIGFKIGCTGPGTIKLFGMRGPIRGTLFDKEVYESGVELNANSFCNLAVEAEMAIKVDSDRNILSVFPIIELHNFIFRAPQKSLAELIANNGLNRGIVSSVKTWEKQLDFYENKSALSLEVNGSEIDSGELWPMEGGPTSSLDWLKNHLADHDLEILSGNIILGGTALGLHKVQAGDRIDVKVDGENVVNCFIN